jgi:photosystem II stability/assembly factor-like uncharacterized protein
MNKTLKILFLFLITANLTFAQTGWFQQNSGGTAYYESVFFVNELTGWAAGGDIVSKTTNGGNNWLSTQLSGLGLYSIFFINSLTGWAVSNQLVIKTTNGGNNWTNQTVPPNTRFLYSVYFVDEMTGWAAGDILPGLNQLADSFDVIIKTTNGGNNWFSVYSNSIGPNFYSIFFIDALTGWVCGSWKVGKTINGGINWFFTPINIYATLRSIHFINALTGWTPSWGSDTVYKSTDGGISWIPIPIGFSGGWRSIRFTDSQSGWIVGDGGVIIKSTNGGMNWGVQTSGVNVKLKSVFFVNENTGWIVGHNGIILKTTDGGGSIVGIIPNNEVPKKFTLSQNYPNPFNPKTIIEFQFPGKSSDINGSRFVILKVYEITGKEVATLVNQKLNPGVYNVEFDGSGFSSGVYFYKLESEGFSNTKKMILIR